MLQLQQHMVTQKLMVVLEILPMNIYKFQKKKVQIKLRHGTGHKSQKEKQEKYT